MARSARVPSARRGLSRRHCQRSVGRAELWASWERPGERAAFPAVRASPVGSLVHPSPRLPASARVCRPFESAGKGLNGPLGKGASLGPGIEAPEFASTSPEGKLLGILGGHHPKLLSISTPLSPAPNGNFREVETHLRRTGLVVVKGKLPSAKMHAFGATG